MEKPPEDKPRRKNRRCILLLTTSVTAVCLIGAIVGVLFYLSGRNNNTKKSDDSNEAQMFEGEVTLQKEYKSSYNDTTSTDFKEFAHKFESEMDVVFLNMNYSLGDAYNATRVISLRKGSLVVTFHTSWKSSRHVVKDKTSILVTPITDKLLRNTVANAITKATNTSLLWTAEYYSVAMKKIPISSVLSSKLSITTTTTEPTAPTSSTTIQTSTATLPSIQDKSKISTTVRLTTSSSATTTKPIAPTSPTTIQTTTVFAERSFHLCSNVTVLEQYSFQCLGTFFVSIQSVTDVTSYCSALEKIVQCILDSIHTVYNSQCTELDKWNAVITHRKTIDTMFANFNIEYDVESCIPEEMKSQLSSK